MMMIKIPAADIELCRCAVGHQVLDPVPLVDGNYAIQPEITNADWLPVDIRQRLWSYPIVNLVDEDYA